MIARLEQDTRAGSQNLWKQQQLASQVVEVLEFDLGNTVNVLTMQ